MKLTKQDIERLCLSVMYQLEIEATTGHECMVMVCDSSGRVIYACTDDVKAMVRALGFVLTDISEKCR